MLDCFLFRSFFEDLIIDVTGGLAQLVKLWQNSSPTTSFGNVTITINNDNEYSFYLIECVNERYGTLHFSFLVPVNGKSSIMHKSSSTLYNYMHVRNVECNNGEISFSTANSIFADGGSMGGYGAYDKNMPLAVYGLRF